MNIELINNVLYYYGYNVQNRLSVDAVLSFGLRTISLKEFEFCCVGNKLYFRMYICGSICLVDIVYG